MKMDKTYQPQEIETYWSKYWEEKGYFKPNPSGNPPYCIMLPPPNVTGTLHMGHGFQHTLMDALVRRQRMKGCQVLFQPGTDHAGIATQIVVERELTKTNRTRQEIGREAFLSEVWRWCDHSDGIITRQIRRMGASLDWSRIQFSMDPTINAATNEAFIRLYEEGLIYRGKRLVNWDPQLNTAVSDLEVVTESIQGHLWYIRYPLDKEYITVATTRPETLLGDVAIAVHPDDDRYSELIGQYVQVPLTERKIPIIGDEAVDASFGTGCVKVTPAHDFTDYEIGKRHQLPMINILTLDACLNDNVPPAYQGLERFVARKKIIADLTKVHLLEKVEQRLVNIPKGERSGVVIEPLLTDQWFLKMETLAPPAIAAVERGEVSFVPENWTKTYKQWLNNIQDWCISRQLWWGHRIPIWYDEENHTYAGIDEQEVRQRYQLKADIPLRQEDDVLDTWLTAALYPFSTLHWPQTTIDLVRFYPSNVLVTGFDIIFFWVARMIMMGLKLIGNVPFQEVYVTGLIRDSQGQKMSKSKGNILDPIDLVEGIDLETLIIKRTTGLLHPQMAAQIEKNTRKEFPRGIAAHGADALRFTFCALANTGRDINFDMGRIQGYRHFCNKLWNAARFVLMNTENQDLTTTPELSIADRWIQSIFQTAIDKVNRAFDQYRFDLITQALYEFTWNEFCDWYVELAKCQLNSPQATASQRSGTRQTLLQVLETLLRLIHPIIPFISETIWQSIAPLIQRRNLESIMLAPYPEYDASFIDSPAEQHLEWLKQFITTIRTLRSEMNVSPAKKVPILLRKGQEQDHNAIQNNEYVICNLANIASIQWLTSNEKPPESATAVMKELEIHLPLADLIDKEAEMARLQKEIEKLIKEQQQSATKLENPHYTAKAPVEVVEKERQRYLQSKNVLNKLQEQLKHLAQ